ncbi:energy-coupling factor transport system substrate-specific component [Aequitasia blattaphilus]|uniref:Energy-coupling factor transport system substrate-specific component n=1 Tax=Aequitasia blattaphilus TaxID=2949332 RepID=A0ABT1E6Q2_9FIRM|nr:hypothetical protein [Aequitasia blattaphilus]MCP1101513.1 hypothetical protein [Aequitasia blattaphilus]MCR8614153.1 hypothetical protein [Aequitasia blattaphilus]
MNLRLPIQQSSHKTKKGLTVKELAVLSLSAALLVVLQISLGFLPNIEVISLLIIVFSLVYKWKTLYVIYGFALLEGLFYGFGIWWFMYLYVWTILCIIVIALKKNKSVLVWSLVSGFFGLSFGFLCSIPYLFAGGIGGMLAWWISGIPFDIIHGVANFFITLYLFKPIYHLVGKLYYQ